MKKNEKGFIIFPLVGLILTILFVLLVYWWVIVTHHGQSIQVSGPSMEPTIKSGQIVHIHPYDFGKSPQRGDIVEYKLNEHLSKQYNLQENKLIKRVVGIPGDRVVISNNSLTIYNPQNPKGFKPDLAYNVGTMQTAGNIDVQVSQGEYFVLGDNRMNSLDSRITGTVKLEDIFGKISL